MGIHPFHIAKVEELHFQSPLSMTVILVACIDGLLLKFADVLVDIPPKLPYESLTIQSTNLTDIFVTFGNVRADVTGTRANVELVYTLIRTESSPLCTQAVNV